MNYKKFFKKNNTIFYKEMYTVCRQSLPANGMHFFLKLEREIQTSMNLNKMVMRINKIMTTGKLL